LEADLQYLSVRRDNVMALGAGDDLEGEDMRGSARLPAFVGGRSQANGYADPGGEQLLQLLQQGWMNPMGLRRSDLQRVAYVVEEGQLLRVSWAERNQPVLGEALTERVLLENVVNPRVRFLPADASNLEDGWADVWPLPAAASAAEAQQDDSLPLALELSFDREGMGNVRRTFVLPFL